MSWAHYLVQVNIYLVIFYCFYQLLLAKETYFILNRVYLLAAGLLSLIIPFLKFSWFTETQITQKISVGATQLNNIVLQPIIVNEQKFNWGNFIVIAYIIGITFFVIKFIVQLLAVKKQLNIPNSGTAFSFLNKKVVSANLPEQATVNLHEEVHVKQLHTLDVIFFEILGIFIWFNPVVYAYKSTLKNIHEYLADETAAKFNGDKEAYALLLLSQAFGVKPSELTNGFFNKSLIKKRIFMLHKQRSKKVAILKYGLFVPLFALTLLFSAATIGNNNQVVAVAAQIPLNNAKTIVAQIIEVPISIVNIRHNRNDINKVKLDSVLVTNVAIDSVKSVPKMDEFYSFFAKKVRYPVEAIKNSIQGNTLTTFTVTNGAVSNVNTHTKLGGGCDEEIKNKILEYNNYTNFNNGNYVLKVSYNLVGSDEILINDKVSFPSGYMSLQTIFISTYMPKANTTQDPVYEFTKLTKPPTYPGGMTSFADFLGKNIKYPKSAIAKKIEGKVLLSFVIAKDGSVTDIQVVSKLGEGTDEEAVRVLKLSEKWIPGSINGKAVSCRYNLPIAFGLYKKNKRTVKLKGTYYNQDIAERNKPLFVLNGEIKDEIFFKELDPNTITSVEIIKDEKATELYGLKAINGVVLIKTKITNQKNNSVYP